MKSKLTSALLFLFILSFLKANAQLKQVYKDTDEDNDLRKICFYSKTEGYVAFKKWIGYSTDGGKSFQKKSVTISNVNFNGYSPNLTFGFAITGIKAFDKNNLILYGDYGLVPAILSSSDGGSTFKLVFHSQPSPTTFSYIVDLVFPENGNIGYAIDQTRVFKTTDKGLNWTLIRNEYSSELKRITAPTNTSIYVIGNTHISKSTNSGSTWNNTSLPNSFQGQIRDAFFLTATKGWLNCEINGKGQVFSTNDGASNYTLQNNINATSFVFEQMKFLDDNVGFALGENYTTYKTTDGGKIWEPLPRDNSFSFLSYTHYEMQFWDANQFWVGGGHGFLESTDNGGGTPLPGVYFVIDQTNLGSTNKVTLTNYSKTGYTYEWFRNGVSIATTYHSSFERDPDNLTDVIKLVVKNGNVTNSLEKKITLSPPVSITSFYPQKAGQAMDVTITGVNFGNVSSVTFGGKPATLKSITPTKIVANVGTSASGAVTVNTSETSVSVNGFEYVPPPTGNAPLVIAITPAKGVEDEYVSIIGYNIASTNVSVGNVKAEVVNTNAKLINAYVGNGTNGPVSVRTADGTSSIDGFTFINPATITSFSPEKATIGSKVTIVGRHFNPVASKNKVQFGGVAAQIISASATAIEVIVPAGAAFKEISVASDGKIAYSPKPFSVLFPNGNGIKTESFSKELDIASKGTVATVFTADIDGDGKLDLIANSIFDGYRQCRVYRNTSTAQALSFDSGYEIAGIVASLVADVDGDGKNDIITNSRQIYANTSKPGAISFVILATIDGSRTPYALMDMDGDSKPDVLTTSGVYKSVAAADGLKFRAIQSHADAGNLSYGDLNGDGKVDLALSGLNATNATKILINESRIGKINYASPVNVQLLDLVGIKIVDLDGDGKGEIVGANGFTRDLTILPNTTKSGTVSFGEPIIHPIPFLSWLCEIADIDGDGRPDIIGGGERAVYIYKNVSDASGVKFAKQVAITDPGTTGNFALADLDGDGKMEIIIPHEKANTITIHKNNVKADPVIFDFYPKYGGSADKIVITGTNFDQTTSVKFGDATATFTVDSPSQLTATLGTGASGEITVTTPVGTNSIVGFQYGKLPVITSISKTSGNAGTTVILTGDNFSTVASENLVKFGLIKASVVTATKKQLTVTVPSGATLGYLSVNVSGLVAYSPTQFSLTFPYDYSGFTKNSFSNPIDIPKLEPASGNIVDLDNDGRMDIVRFLYNNGGISIAKNNTENGILSFAPPINYSNKENMQAISIGDIDGDGKQDVIARNGIDMDGNISIYRNTSENGNISLAPRMPLFATEGNEAYIGPFKIMDIDRDGRNDIILCSKLHKRISILLNRSVNGKLNFTYRFDLNVDHEVVDVEVGDMNNDGLLDLVAVTEKADAIVVFLNKWDNGKLAFEKAKYFAGQAKPSKLKLADFDNDGSLDIIYYAITVDKINILRNNSTGSNISFDSEISFTAPYSADFALTDFDGDGKIDFALHADQMYFFKNTTQGNKLAFAKEVKFMLVNTVFNENACPADVDGDGLPDLVIFGGAPTGVMLRKPHTVKPTITSLSHKSAYAGMTVTIYGLELQEATAVTFGGVPVKSFHVFGPRTISVVIGDGAAGDVVVTTPNGEARYSEFAFLTLPTITAITPSYGKKGAEITLTGTGFATAKSLSFGDSPAASFTVISDTQMKGIVGEGSTGYVQMVNANNFVQKGTFIFLADPVISTTMPTAIKPGEKVDMVIDYNAKSGNNFNYVWTKNGVVISGATGTSYSATEVGTYEVYFIHEGNKLISNSIIVTTNDFTFSSFSPAYGKKGVEITIKGAALQNVRTVTFGGVTARVRLISNTELKATVEDGSTGAVAIQTASATLTKTGFTYLVEPTISTNASTILKAGGSVLLTIATNAKSGNNFNYVWTKNGEVIVGASAMSYTATQVGIYKVYFIFEGNKLESNSISITSEFTLPVTNFKIKTTGSSCKSKNDGTIDIEAVQNLNYVATVIKAGGTALNYNFNKETKITNLSPGNYSICITVVGQANYQQCYNVVITEPNEIKLSSTVFNDDQTITLTMSGAPVYLIDFNNKTYQSTSGTITLPLAAGSNKLTISSTLVCQGIIEKTILLDGGIKIFPNPFEQELYLQLPVDPNQKNTSVKVYDLVGKLVNEQNLINQSGILTINLSHLPQGVYLIKIVNGKTVHQSKIIKK